MLAEERGGITIDKRMFIINVIKAVFDALVSVFAILGCAWGANHFSRWWILLFAILPMLLYYSSGIVVIGDPVEEEGDNHS